MAPEDHTVTVYRGKKNNSSPMLARQPPLQVLPSFLRVLGLGSVSIPRVYPTETVADPTRGGGGRTEHEGERGNDGLGPFGARK